MTGTLDRQQADLRGPRSMARSFGSNPLLSSECRGWHDLAVCQWRVKVDEYHLPAIPEAMIVLHTEGVVEYRKGRTWGAAQSLPGQVSLIPPGTSASFRRHGMLSGITMHLSTRRLRHLLGDEEAERATQKLQTRVGFADPFIVGVAHSLADEIRDPSERGSLYADAMADAVGLHVLCMVRAIGHEPADHGGLSSQALRTVRERIEAELASGFSLTELAEGVGLSRFQFTRAFQKAMGMSPRRYVTERRIERAKTLLRFGDLPLAEVALECGFSSQAHLCERFRAVAGVSPGQYRRSR